MLKKCVDSVCLRDILHSQIPEKCRLTGTAPCTGFQIRELPDGIQMIPVAVQDKADLVQVISVQFTSEDHFREGAADRYSLRVLAFSARVKLDDRLALLLKMLAREQTVVALQIELQSSRVEPVHDMSALLRGYMLMQEDFPAVLNIRTVPADQAVKADVPDLVIYLRLAAARADIDKVPVLPRLTDSFDSRTGNLILIIGERPVYIDK